MPGEEFSQYTERPEGEPHREHYHSIAYLICITLYHETEGIFFLIGPQNGIYIVIPFIVASISYFNTLA